MAVEIRTAVIGLGVGEQHALGYDAHPACRLVALCDVDPEQLRTVGSRFPDADLVEEPERVLADPSIDAVSIASYDDAHFDQVALALRHGKHVFVEKPVCLHKHELVELRRLSRARPELRVSSNLILRRSPRFAELRDAIRSGDYGQVYYVEGDYDYGRLWKLTEGWRGEIDFYSVVHGGAIHVVDLLTWLTSDRIVEVAAFGNDISSRGSRFRYRDLVASVVRFESGMVGKISANFGAVRPHFHRLAVYGTGGTFFNGPAHAVRFDSRDPEVPPTKLTSAYPGAAKGDLIGDFVSSILSDSPGAVTTEEVFDTMSVCLAIEEAAETGRVVTVDYL